MISKSFWLKVAENWSKEDDGISVPDDKASEAEKVMQIKTEEMDLFNSISNDEIDDILSDLGLDDI